MMDDIVKLDIMDSSSTLFEKTIPVRVMKLPGSDDRLMELTVRIVMGISKPHRSSKVERSVSRTSISHLEFVCFFITI